MFMYVYKPNCSEKVLQEIDYCVRTVVTRSMLQNFLLNAEFFRAWRAWSLETHFLQECKNIQQRLQQCGYFRKIITRASNIVEHKNRHDCLFEVREKSKVSGINCSSTHVIYCIVCTECSLQYIRCTIRKLRVRINEHINGAKNTSFTTRAVSGASNHF